MGKTIFWLSAQGFLTRVTLLKLCLLDLTSNNWGQNELQTAGVESWAEKVVKHCLECRSYTCIPSLLGLALVRQTVNKLCFLKSGMIKRKWKQHHIAILSSISYYLSTGEFFFFPHYHISFLFLPFLSPVMPLGIDMRHEGRKSRKVLIRKNR